MQYKLGNMLSKTNFLNDEDLKNRSYLKDKLIQADIAGCKILQNPSKEVGFAAFTHREQKDIQ